MIILTQDSQTKTEELEELINLLSEHKKVLETSVPAQEIVNGTFIKRWKAIEEEETNSFEEKKSTLKSVLRLEIALIESIRDFLDPAVVDDLSKIFVKVRFSDDLRQAISVYHKHRDLIEIRQVFKLITAVYRHNRNLLNGVKDSYYRSSVSILKSQIKYATICPHCGHIAKQILMNMQKTGAVQLP